MACCSTMVAEVRHWQNSEMEVDRTPESSTQTDLSYQCNNQREELNIHAWAWDSDRKASNAIHTILLSNDYREVKFHPSYSSGTGAIRGDTEFVPNHDYYWEIKVLTPLYGTDVMIGVGTGKVDLAKQEFTFCSMLGLDQESWGYSYTGAVQHNAKWKSYGPGFNKHSTVGVHLDMWNGRLSFFLNGKPLGVAFTLLKNQTLYPMVSSTAAHSGIRLIYSYTCSSSLQQLCLRSLSSEDHMMKLVSSIPGLRGHIANTFLNYETAENEDDEEEQALHNTNTYQSGFVIEESDDEYFGEIEKRRRKKRKYTGEVKDVNSPSTSRRMQIEDGCVQCGASFMSREILERRTNVPSPTPSMVFRLQNTLCIICDDIV